MLAHSDARDRLPARRATIDELLIAASSACRSAPADGPDLVIDTLPSYAADDLNKSCATTPIGAKEGFPTSINLVAAYNVPVRIKSNNGQRARSADGTAMAKLRRCNKILVCHDERS